MENVGSRRRLGGTGLILLFLVGYALDSFLQTWWLTAWLNAHVPDMVNHTLWPIRIGFGVLLHATTVCTAISTLTRAFGPRYRFSAIARRFPVFAHRVLPWIPGALWLLGNLLRNHARMIRHYQFGWLEGTVVVSLAMLAAVKFGLRQLDDGTATPEAESAASSEETGARDDLAFAAVAVTSTTRGAVGALVAASAAMVIFVATIPTNLLFNDVRVVAAILAYAAAALGAATIFRRVSRIVVGIDGVLVLGAGRARFYGYSALDEVRVSWGDIVLLHRGRTVVRLQLHGADVARRDALVDRLRKAMDHASRMRTDDAGSMVRATLAGKGASRRLASSSLGAGDYRQPAIAREQLWELVEGPLSEAGTRTTAAEALSAVIDADDRARLRIAAAACAEPAVRVALEKLADDEEDDDVAEDAVALPRRALPART